MKLLESDLDETIDSLRNTDYFERLSGSNILLTGACGFLGQYFIQLFLRLNKLGLVAEPIQIIAVDNNISSEWENSHSEDSCVYYKRASVAELDSRWYGNFMPFDYILCAAGIASPQYYRKFPMETIQIVTNGLQSVLEFATRTKPRALVFFSSSEIYGNPDPSHVPTDESYNGNVSCLGPRSCYDESKRLGETMCRVAAQEWGVPTRIIRPFNVYGPGSMKNDYRALPNFVSSALEGRQIQIYGTGDQTRTFCYVSDAISGFLRVMMDGQDGEPYNVGNPTPEISVRGLLSEVEKAFEKPLDYKIIPHPPEYPADEPQRRCPSIARAADLGYRPQVSLQEGLRRFIGWARTEWE